MASTVTQIQASEQAIETPWQNQLTALKAQDTALSSLGTDLSALSTSLQKLTDFEGVFAEKQGSSSNTDLLSLTSASSTAAAGSHTIEVSQLAQTSSEVSSAISNANDTLSGTVTIQGQEFDTSTRTTTRLRAWLLRSIRRLHWRDCKRDYDSSGSRLSIVSGTSRRGGTVERITTIICLVPLRAGNISFSTGQVGQDANLTVDGVPITSPSNTVTNAIPGVTFQLLASSSTPVQVQITDDTTDIGTAISSFVSAYNKVIGDINRAGAEWLERKFRAAFGKSADCSITGIAYGISRSPVRRVVRSTTSLSWDSTLTMTAP